jgi:hypothetical protein
MPRMPAADEVLAICISDIHLSHRPPPARAGEPDWYAAMARPLQKVRNLQLEINAPVLIAGDIFHRWDSPAELINFAMDALPSGAFAIPGQHDLPFHGLHEAHKSAYTTLIRAGKIQEAPPAGVMMSVNVNIYGAPWRHKWSPPPEYVQDGHTTNILLAHRYVWIHACAYPGAFECDHVKNLDLTGYDIAVFGDNHKGFAMWQRDKTPLVINCGGFMRRNADEIDYTPKAWLIQRAGDGEIYARSFSVRDPEDVFDAAAPSAYDPVSREDLEKVGQFIQYLQGTTGVKRDFLELLAHYLDREPVREATKNLLLELIHERR